MTENVDDEGAWRRNEHDDDDETDENNEDDDDKHDEDDNIDEDNEDDNDGEVSEYDTGDSDSARSQAPLPMHGRAPMVRNGADPGPPVASLCRVSWRRARFGGPAAPSRRRARPCLRCKPVPSDMATTPCGIPPPGRASPAQAVAPRVAGIDTGASRATADHDDPGRVPEAAARHLSGLAGRFPGARRGHKKTRRPLAMGRGLGRGMRARNDRGGRVSNRHALQAECGLEGGDADRVRTRAGLAAGCGGGPCVSRAHWHVQQRV